MTTTLRFLWLWRSTGWTMVAVVLIACLMPRPPDVPVISSDKAHHFIAFAGLACWWRWCSHTWWVPGLLLIAFGGLIEVLQGTCTTRHAEWQDVLADSIGVILGLLLAATPLRTLLPWIETKLTRHGP